jgi:hypothetical protein
MTVPLFDTTTPFEQSPSERQAQVGANQPGCEDGRAANVQEESAISAVGQRPQRFADFSTS